MPHRSTVPGRPGTATEVAESSDDLRGGRETLAGYPFAGRLKLPPDLRRRQLDTTRINAYHWIGATLSFEHCDGR
jgi:hypothetical protein